MDAMALRALQTPLKQKYRDNPDSARIVALAAVVLNPSQIAAQLRGDGLRVAGLHQAAGAGVTVLAVATSMGFQLSGGKVVAEGI